MENNNTNLLDLQNQHISTPSSSLLNQPEKSQKPKRFIRSFLEFIFSLIIIIIAANLIHKFIFHPFYVIGESMLPSFQDGNYLFVDKLSYRFNKPQRGDVIVFTPPWDQQNQYVEKEKQKLGWFKYQINKWIIKIQSIIAPGVKSLESREYIKRIIGLPGETIAINNLSQVIIKNTENPDGIILPETYIKSPTKGELEVSLKENEYFVMGDNRSNSSDSRGYSFTGEPEPHLVPTDSIEGKVMLRLWPVDKIGIINNPDYTRS